MNLKRIAGTGSRVLALFLAIGAVQGRAPAPTPAARAGPELPETVEVPARRFTLGSPGDAAPGRVSVPAFRIARTETTVDQFAAFVAETAYRTKAERSGGCWVAGPAGVWRRQRDANWRSPGFPQTGRHPVVCVSWHDAVAYVDWLRQRSGRPFRLPSEAEYERLLRHHEGHAWPWGATPEGACGAANLADQALKRRWPNWAASDCDDGWVHTAPVASYAADAFGLHDVSGNAFEWTADCWNPDHRGFAPDGGARTSGDCGRRVRRGGSWGTALEFARATARANAVTRNANNALGFRVAEDITR